MVVERGEIWWAELAEPRGSEPGNNRPVLIIQRDSVNRSRLNTVLVVVLTTNLRLVGLSGNVLLRSVDSGLPRDSVVNVSQVLAIDKEFLYKRVGKLRSALLTEVDVGLRFIMDLDANDEL